jgi:hypothetical protein
MDEFHRYADHDRGVAWQGPLLSARDFTRLDLCTRGEKDAVAAAIDGSRFWSLVSCLTNQHCDGHAWTRRRGPSGKRW